MGTVESPPQDQRLTTFDPKWGGIGLHPTWNSVSSQSKLNVLRERRSVSGLTSAATMKVASGVSRIILRCGGRTSRGGMKSELTDVGCYEEG